MDMRILGQPTTWADVTSEDVARAAGWDLERIGALSIRKRAVDGIEMRELDVGVDDREYAEIAMPLLGQIVQDGAPSGD